MSKHHLNQLVNMFSQPSWRLANKDIELYITQLGGHLAPANYFCQDQKFQPFSIPPWHDERFSPDLPNIVKILRGDFFCMPFGNGVLYEDKGLLPTHGETANSLWQFVEQKENDLSSFLRLALQSNIFNFKIDKQLTLNLGEQAIYCRHLISNYVGKLNFGHHAMLKFQEQGTGLISVSPFKYGQVFPKDFEDPAQGGYSSLLVGAEFESLTSVPLANGGVADLSTYPARLGFEDLVLVAADETLPFAWSAAVYPQEGVVWFSLKDPKKLASTIIWHSNRGRHYAPWLGRHVGVLGLEEVTSYFHTGLTESISNNPLNARGIATCHNFQDGEVYNIPYIMAMAKIDKGFDHVARIEVLDNNKGVCLISKSGKRATALLDLRFLFS